MTDRDLQVQEKDEKVEGQGEMTEAGRYFLPQTDIHESGDALTVTMDMPGVGKQDIDIQLEKNVLTVTGKIDFDNYKELVPIYTEYNVGNYSRSFNISREIDQDKISASIKDGVLSLNLPKAAAASAKSIKVT